MQPLVLSGQRTILKANGTVVGAGFVIDYRLGTEQFPIYTVDSPLPAELAPDKISVSMSIRVYRTPDNDPVAAGIAPPGDLSGSGTGVNPRYTEARYIAIEIRDKVTDQTVLYLPRAAVVSRSASVSSEDLMTETWQIMGIGFYGPTGQTSGLVPAFANLGG
jgi:hypothetical protein